MINFVFFFVNQKSAMSVFMKKQSGSNILLLKLLKRHFDVMLFFVNLWNYVFCHKKKPLKCLILSLKTWQISFLFFFFSLIRFVTSVIIPAFVNFPTDYPLVALYCVITWKPTSRVPLAPAFATSWKCWPISARPSSSCS